MEVDGRGDCLRFYGSATVPGTARSSSSKGTPVQRNGRTDTGQTVWSVPPRYTQLSPSIVQAEAEQYAAATRRPFINLARPGIFASSGNRLERRRKREVDLVNAVDRLKDRFGSGLISLAGLAGPHRSCCGLHGFHRAYRRRQRGCSPSAPFDHRLTDPMDAVVTATSQGTYSAALQEAGVKVEQRSVTAPDASHHLLRIPAILAALA